MKVKHVTSLLWFSRWHNGRAEQIERTYRQHLSQVEELVRERLSKRKSCCYRRFTICGIRLVVSLDDYTGLTIHEIASPQSFTGVQRNLFTARQQKKPAVIELKRGAA